MEGYCFPSARVAGHMELPGDEGLYARASFGFSQLKVQGSPDILPWSKVNDVLGELHEGSLRGHLGFNKTLDKDSGNTVSMWE
jgi:hypothetical protein